jgi:steroid 5-alpha reductase family enzyme
MSTLTLALVATGALAAGFAGVLLLARRLDNYGIVDVAWPYAFAPVALGYALGTDGAAGRRLALATMVGLWSLRLGTHLGRRVWRHHPEEDGRYRQLRRDWAENFSARMFGFFQLQALSVAGLALPFLLAMRNSAAFPRPLEIAGMILWCVALGGEALADRQLARFKRHAPRGAVCDAGLWRYSRHPNYFFEWLVWVAFFVFASSSPWGWLGVIAPAAMLFLLLRVTGIPLTEEQAVRSKGEAYRRYQQRTYDFMPCRPI